LVILNRHPYSNGHLMVAPRAHLPSPLRATPGEQTELWQVVLLAQRALETSYAPPGMNVGLNLGRVAGAGVPDHFHVHLVPRWEGDTNFMTAIGHTRLIPEALERTRERLLRVFAGLAGAAA
jgi:ATP adenylyltransferase